MEVKQKINTVNPLQVKSMNGTVGNKTNAQ